MFNIHKVSTELGGRELIIETGKMARQAGGSVVITYGETSVLVTATASSEGKDDIDFMPLTVDFVEKSFAAGKIPGGFFKREGKPSENATLTSRLIDRPLRPMFPEGFTNETQVIATVLSVDFVNEPDILAMIGASAALTISNVPFPKPLAGCRVGRLDGKFVINPSVPDMENSDVDVMVAVSEDSVVMVEGGGAEVSEADMFAAIQFAHKELQPVIALQKELQAKCGKEKIEVTPPQVDEDLFAKVNTLEPKVKEAMQIKVKHDRYQAIADIKDAFKAELFPEGTEEDPKVLSKVSNYYGQLKSKVMRTMILKDNVRIDGRSLTDIRPIETEVGVVPRTHGTGLFTRGETQALVVATLGSKDDKQKIDYVGGEYTKRFMLHYNFPPFSVGEVKFLRSPGRREIGHGALAERALSYVLPDEDSFPYAIRIVSEVLESNGSSSMATVCGGSMALMDAGVPVKAPVAGIAMGLIKEENDTAILSDILGDEDHLGDMDFKVAGTEKGVTAIQMDIKIDGVSADIMEKALEQARQGRLHILDKMAAAITAGRDSLSQHAPKIEVMKVKVNKIKDVIGSGGKNIKGIIEETGVKMDIDDDGTVNIFSSDAEAIEKAKEMVNALVAEAEVDKVYTGKVKKIMDFGAFVEILPKTDGLVHISQISNERVNQVSDVLSEGDEVTVKCIGIDDRGKIKLSMKAIA